MKSSGISYLSSFNGEEFWECAVNRAEMYSELYMEKVSDEFEIFQKNCICLLALFIPLLGVATFFISLDVVPETFPLAFWTSVVLMLLPGAMHSTFCVYLVSQIFCYVFLLVVQVFQGDFPHVFCHRSQFSSGLLLKDILKFTSI